MVTRRQVVDVGTTRVTLDLDTLARRHADGQSVLRMANELGVSRPVIVRRLTELDLPVRSGSEANLLRAGRMSAAERRANTAAANEARRTSGGREPRGVRTFTRRGVHTRPDEEGIARLRPDWPRQVAVGPYNLDFRCGPVAVEVHGAATDPSRRPELQRRTMHLLDAGWSVVYLWRDGPGREDVIAWAEATSRNVPEGGEYRVVRGDGEVVASGRGDLDELSVME